MAERIFLTACSDPRGPEQRGTVEKLAAVFRELGFEPEESPWIFSGKADERNTGRQRAEALMDYYRRPEGRNICDISGGDLANGVLPYLDFEKIKNSEKIFWGYSDLTCILNAIYARTGRPSVLWQVMNLVGSDGKEQQRRFRESSVPGKGPLYDICCRFIQGNQMEGILLGGNIRCLLKLAGTVYWPDFSGKLLLLESRGGGVSRIQAYFAQLEQLGIFRQVAGILLGTFTELESRTDIRPEKLLLPYLPEELPLAVTREIGHGSDSKAAVIGGKLRISKDKTDA